MTAQQLPTWLQAWIGVITPVGQVLLIALVAWLLQRFIRRVMRRAGDRYRLAPEVVVGARRVCGFLVYATALLLALERLGVSGTWLWGAFTSFAAVGAVAFFAAWSVLSNIFCAMLIFTTRPFRLYDYIELIEGGDKPGFRGQVTDINLIYTTLREVGADPQGGGGSVLQVPNSLFFQRAVRRWRGDRAPRAWIDSPDAGSVP